MNVNHINVLAQLGFFLWIMLEAYLFKYAFKKINKIEKRDVSSEFKTELAYLSSLIIVFNVNGYDPLHSFIQINSIVGFILMLAMISLRLLGVKALGSNYTLGVEEVKDQTLVTTGIFKYMRNPCDLGNLGCLLAFSILFNAPLIGLFLTLGIARFIYLPRFEVEESFLKEKFGKAYESYYQSLPSRYFPRFHK